MAKASTVVARRGRRRSYHHGDLRQTLLDTTLAVIEELGVENTTVRDVARRAGVSSGAPFRHFPDRRALLTAVAEDAMGRLREEVAAEMAKPRRDPLASFRAVGAAYLRWVVRNPTHFRVISERSLIDFEGSASLRRDNDALRALMAGLLAEARDRGQLRGGDIGQLVLLARAASYGIARMFVDGQLQSWDISDRQAQRAMEKVLDSLLDGLRA